MAKIGDPIPGTNLFYEPADIELLGLDAYTDEQKRRADAKQKQEDREFQVTNDLRNNQQTF